MSTCDNTCITSLVCRIRVYQFLRLKIWCHLKSDDGRSEQGKRVSHICNGSNVAFKQSQKRCVSSVYCGGAAPWESAVFCHQLHVYLTELMAPSFHYSALLRRARTALAALFLYAANAIARALLSSEQLGTCFRHEATFGTSISLRQGRRRDGAKINHKTLAQKTEGPHRSSFGCGSFPTNESTLLPCFLEHFLLVALLFC